jgi:peroxiredoxin
MKRVNWPLWLAAPLGIATLFSYILVFLRWPITRDTPWVNVLLAVATIVLAIAGVRRAFSRTGSLPAKILAIPLVAVALFGVGSFAMIRFKPQHLPLSLGAPQVGQPAPAFSLLDTENRQIALHDLLTTALDGRPPKGVLLIFEMGHGCHACSSELHDVQRHLDALRQAGIRPVAISNDAPDVSQATARTAGYTFTFLSDPQHETIKRFDLEDPQEGGAARPAEFLLDASGVVRWRMLTNNIFVRPQPAQVMANALR